MKYLFLLLFSCCAPLFAFSLYSMDRDPHSLNAGEPVSSAGARLDGMGGAGIALSDTLNYSVANPASFATTDYTIISITYTPEITYLKDAREAGTSMVFGNDFPAAHLVVPMGRWGTLYTGYKRDRLLDYDIRYTASDGLLVHRFGSGGTYIAQAGYAVPVLKRRLLLGAAFGGLYGDTRLGNAVEGRPAGADTLISSTYQKTLFSGFSCDLGATWRAGALSLAAAAVLPLTRTDAVSEFQLIKNYSPSDSIVTKHSSDVSIASQPVSVTFGLAYAPSRRLNLVLDASGVKWDLADRGNEYRLGAGMEYFFTDKRSDNYFENIPLRFGYYYRDLGRNDGILEQALTLGWTLPTAGFFGNLNFAVEGGMRYRESIRTSDYTETFSRISIQYVHKGRWGRLRRAATGDF